MAEGRDTSNFIIRENIIFTGTKIKSARKGEILNKHKMLKKARFILDF